MEPFLHVVSKSIRLRDSRLRDLSPSFAAIYCDVMSKCHLYVLKESLSVHCCVCRQCGTGPRFFTKISVSNSVQWFRSCRHILCGQRISAQLFVFEAMWTEWRSRVKIPEVLDDVHCAQILTVLDLRNFLFLSMSVDYAYYFTHLMQNTKYKKN